MTPEANALMLSTLLLALVLGSTLVTAGEGRIKRRPPTPAEADREASDTAMNDSLLRNGDIVVTDRGFLVFRGPAPGGTGNEFAPTPNPLSLPPKRPPR
jgi:hypothetical protein